MTVRKRAVVREIYVKRRSHSIDEGDAARPVYSTTVQFSKPVTKNEDGGSEEVGKCGV